MTYDYIKQGECLELMKEIPDGSIDAIICDLPYGTTRNKWDSIIPLDALWKEYKRIIKYNGAIVLFSQQPFTSILVCSNLGMFKYQWIWQKEAGTGFLNANYAPLKSHEEILVFGYSPTSYTKNGEQMVYNPQFWESKPYKMTRPADHLGKNYDSKHDKPTTTISDGKRYPLDVVKYNRDKSKIHPTQKPVALLQYLIRTYTNEGDVVLDNTMGSGSTCVAAIKEHRHYIGFELQPEYFEIARKRINNEKAQLTLF